MKNNVVIFLILSVFLLTSCVSKTAVGDINYVSNDINERVEIKRAKKKRKYSSVAISVMGVSTIGGGLIGYNSNLTSYYDEDVKKTNKIANASIGAAIGFGLSYFINSKILGNRKFDQLESDEEAQKWVKKKLKKEYQIINYNARFSDFRIIPDEKESSFRFRNKEDFDDYWLAYSPINTFQFNRCLGYSLVNFDWETLVWLYTDPKKSLLDHANLESIENQIYHASIDRGTKSMSKASELIPRFRDQLKDIALKESNSIRALARFCDYFREGFEEARDKALNLVVSLRSAREFHSEFPASDELLIAHAATIFKPPVLQELGKEFEVRCKNLRSGDFEKVRYYIPPNSFAVISLKHAPIEDIDISYSDIWNTKKTVIHSKIYDPELFEIKLFTSPFHVHYAIKETPTYSTGKYTEIKIENNSHRMLTYCIHNVNNDLPLRIEKAGLSVAIDNTVRYCAGENQLIAGLAVSFITAIAENKNPFKRAILDASKEYILDELNLGVSSDFAGTLIIGYLEDVFKNIP